MGTSTRDWLVTVLASGERGSADLVAYFFLRAEALLRSGGGIGLIATNTVAQGDTRSVGLESMLRRGMVITRAIRSRSWPAASANLEFSAVWGVWGGISSSALVHADGVSVASISSLLEPQGRVSGKPRRLPENAGITFQGCIVLGDGFVIPVELATDWIASDERNADVLFPYLNGEDLTSRPDSSASRWAIDFNDWDEAQAASYPLPYQRLDTLVRPERQRQKPDGAYVLRKPLPQRWWQYAEKRPGLRRAVAGKDEVLVIARVSKTVMPLRVPTGQIFSEACVVFATDDYGVQAILSSSLHQLWAITYGSTLETRVRYTPSDVFETFPQPESTPLLATLGRQLDRRRREIMLGFGIGLTKLYNNVNNPDLLEPTPPIRELRDLHRELDLAVLEAYGWDGISIDYGHHEYRGAYRWTVGPSARVEILDLLLEENHRRAALTTVGASSLASTSKAKPGSKQAERLF